MTKIQISTEEVNDDVRLPAWLARCMLTGFLAGLGGAAYLLFGYHIF